MATLYHLQIANQLFAILSTAYSFLGFSQPSAPRLSSHTADKAPNHTPLPESLNDGEMAHMLKWMDLFFSTSSSTKHVDDVDDTPDPYMQELYNLYCTIRSDYAGYREIVKYNNSLWILPSLRSRNVTSLCAKILTDIKMFGQALQLFAFMRNSRIKENN
jgi:hypothetical protein